MALRRKPGIFCLEGEWSSKLTDRSSVEPLLKTLEQVGRIDYIYRRVTTFDALVEQVQRWGQKQYRSYAVGYFAFHGSPGFLHSGRRRVSLSDLGDMLRGTCRGKMLYFGACETIDIGRREVDAFRQVTGARAVMGFTHSVDWLESAAFDLLLLDALTYYRRSDKIEGWMRGEHGQLCRRLGFKIVYGTSSK